MLKIFRGIVIGHLFLILFYENMFRIVIIAFMDA